MSLFDSLVTSVKKKSVIGICIAVSELNKSPFTVHILHVMQGLVST